MDLTQPGFARSLRWWSSSLLLVVQALLGVAAAATSALAEPVILSTYASYQGANSLRRPLPHAGVDFGAPSGTPVLAAADGIVSLLINYPYGCGIGVSVAHPEFGRWTAYCHMQKSVVLVGQRVRRGEIIGLVGTSGNSANTPHVHFELCTHACASHRDGDLAHTADPLAAAIGCFDRNRHYPTDRLVLTYPVPCRAPGLDAARAAPEGAAR